MITLYDVAAKEGLGTFSPNPWKARYALNYKKLPYKIVALEFPDIEPEFKKLGIPPSTTTPDGSPLYTSPSIIDDATKAVVTDSYKITEYLDNAYPATPRLIPEGSEALQAAFYGQFWRLMRPIFPFLMAGAPVVLNPRSLEYFERTRLAWLGIPLSDLACKGEGRVEEWKKVQEAFDTLYGWLNKSPGPFFMGETISFADFVVASLLKGLKFCLEPDSEEWKDILKWNNGRWKALLDSLEQYANVEN